MAQTQGVNILLYSCHALPFWEGGGTYPFLNWVPRAEDTVEWIPVPELKSLQLGPSDTARFRHGSREIGSFRTISCGIGILIPHEIVRNSNQIEPLLERVVLLPPPPWTTDSELCRLQTTVRVFQLAASNSSNVPLWTKSDRHPGGRWFS